VIHAPDVFAEDWLGDDARNLAERIGSRAVVAAPLLRESNALGAVIVSRAKPAPFNEKEIALLRTFADQAVIAIENVVVPGAPGPQPRADRIARTADGDRRDPAGDQQLAGRHPAGTRGSCQHCRTAVYCNRCGDISRGR
jgi:hypothetical protein